MMTNCNYRIIKHKDNCNDTLIESLKQVDTSTIMIASFDNQFSKDMVKDKSKNLHQKYFTVLDTYNQKEDWWILVRDPKLITIFESKDLKKCK